MIIFKQRSADVHPPKTIIYCVYYPQPKDLFCSNLHKNTLALISLDFSVRGLSKIIWVLSKFLAPPGKILCTPCVFNHT